IVAPDQLIGWAMNEGLPEDIPEIIRRPKSLVKKYDCSWRTPSINQMVASTSCKGRRPSGRAHPAAPPPEVLLPMDSGSAVGSDSGIAVCSAEVSMVMSEPLRWAEGSPFAPAGLGGSVSSYYEA